jgi:hypothetical protein
MQPASKRPKQPPNPLRWFDSSPEVITLRSEGRALLESGGRLGRGKDNGKEWKLGEIGTTNACGFVRIGAPPGSLPPMPTHTVHFRVAAASRA